MNTGLAGLAVTYGLNLNMLQTWVVWNLCNLENKIISVERILQYTNIPSEPPLSTPKDLSLDNSWPAQGDIMLKNLQVHLIHFPMLIISLDVIKPEHNA